MNIMKIIKIGIKKRGSRATEVVEVLPQVFDLAPTTDYLSMISHSGAELQQKAWALTGLQMRDAMNSTHRKLPSDVRRKLTSHA